MQDANGTSLPHLLVETLAGRPREVLGHVTWQDVVQEDLVDLVVALDIILLVLQAHLRQEVQPQVRSNLKAQGCSVGVEFLFVCVCGC